MKLRVHHLHTIEGKTDKFTLILPYSKIEWFLRTVVESHLPGGYFSEASLEPGYLDWAKQHLITQENLNLRQNEFKMTFEFNLDSIAYHADFQIVDGIMYNYPSSDTLIPISALSMLLALNEEYKANPQEDFMYIVINIV